MHVFNYLGAAFRCCVPRALRTKTLYPFNFCQEITNCMEVVHTTLRTI